MVCRLALAAGVFLIIPRSYIGTWQIQRTAVLWTRPTSASQCTSFKPLCRDNSPSSQPAFLPASMTRRPESSTRSHLIQLVAACNQALPQAASLSAPFNPSTRVGCKLSSQVEDPRQSFLPDQLQFRGRAHLTNPPPLVRHQPHRGTSPRRRRPLPTGSSKASTRRRRVTLKPMPQFLS
jgi:hypothetical protein